MHSEENWATVETAKTAKTATAKMATAKMATAKMATFSSPLRAPLKKSKNYQYFDYKKDDR